MWDADDLVIILALLHLWYLRSSRDSTRISCSLNDLCQLVATARGGKYYRDIIGRLQQLEKIYVEVQEEATKDVWSFRVVGSIHCVTKPPRRKDSKAARDPQMELHLNAIHLSAEFVRYVTTFPSHYLRLDQLRSMRLTLSRAIYAFAPGLAYQHAYRRNIKDLLAELGIEPPPLLCYQKKYFLGWSKDGKSVLSELRAARTNNDDQIWAALEDTTVNGKRTCNFVLRIIETVRKPETAMQAIWLDAGKSIGDYRRLLSNIERDVLSYELDLLKQVGVSPEDYAPLLKEGKALLGGDFDSVFASFKDTIKCRRPVNGKLIASPAAYLTDAMQRALRERLDRQANKPANPARRVSKPPGTVPRQNPQPLLPFPPQSMSRQPANDEWSDLKERFFKLAPEEQQFYRNQAIQETNEYDRRYLSPISDKAEDYLLGMILNRFEAALKLNR